MKTKFIIFLILFLNLGFKAQEVDTLETSKKDYSSHNSSIGIGFNSFGSLLSLSYDLFLTSNLYFITSIGTTPFFNGRSGLSIAFCPGFIVFRRNKYNIAFSAGIQYSSAFNSELYNTRSLNNENIYNFNSGGLPISYRNLFSYLVNFDINITVIHRLIISPSLSYFYYRRFQNVDISYFPTLRNSGGFIPNLKVKYQF